MSARHRQVPSTRRRSARALGLGAAGLTAAFAVVPAMAHADTSTPADAVSTDATTSAPATDATTGDAPASAAPSTDAPTTDAPTTDAPSTDAPSTDAPTTDAPSSDAPSTAASSSGAPSHGRVAPAAGADTTTAAPAPNYGTQKYRVGVQLKTGAYVPAGSTLQGVTLTVTTTLADDAPGAPSTTSFDCTTGAPVDGAAYCAGDGTQGPVPGNYTAPAGATVTVTQKTFPTGYALASTPDPLAPCTNGINVAVVRAAAADPVSCGPNQFFGTDLLVQDTGLAPTASDVARDTQEGEAFSFDPLTDVDTHGAPVTDVRISDEPGHGTATLDGPAATPTPTPTVTETVAPLPTITAPVSALRVAAVRVAAATASGYSITYTPAAGFTGVDTFRFSVTTANGTATSLVRITVLAAAVTSTPTVPTDEPTQVTSSAVAASPSDTSSVAAAGGGTSDTGAPVLDLLGAGGALLVLGAGAAVAGRRRGRHAG